jgi:hypothetical protein
MHPSISGLLFHLLHLGTHGRRDERGDVPGWVMVTLMTAIVIAALTPFVGDELRALLEQAFSMVSS